MNNFSCKNTQFILCNVLAGKASLAHLSLSLSPSFLLSCLVASERSSVSTTVVASCFSKDSTNFSEKSVPTGF